jgi:DNA-binding transcriptional regulator YdaS (Cro superfamily)
MSDKQVRAQYTREFKQEAVRQVRSGQAIAVVAKVLGIPKSSLGNWVRHVTCYACVMSKPRNTRAMVDGSVIDRLNDARHGGRDAIAKALGVSVAAVGNWKLRRAVPVEFCAQVERLTQGGLTRRQLRPEDWHLIWPELATNFDQKQPSTLDTQPLCATNGEAVHAPGRLEATTDQQDRLAQPT